MRPLLFPKIALAAVSLAFCGAPSCDHLSQFIQSYGFVELKPPSTLFPPGTLVAIKRHDPFEARIICTAEQSLGAEMKPMRSATRQSSRVNKRKTGMNFSIQALEQIKGDARYENITGLTVSLANPHIATLKDSDVVKYAALRDSSCQEAVALRIAKGDEVTMIHSVLEGDMVIEATWDKSAKMDASAKVAALQHLALEFGVEAGATSETKTSATGLIWGLADDLQLAARTIQEMDEGAYALRQRAIPVETARAWEPKPGKLGLVGGHHNPAAAREYRHAPVPQGSILGLTPSHLMETQVDLDDVLRAQEAAAKRRSRPDAPPALATHSLASQPASVASRPPSLDCPLGSLQRDSRRSSLRDGWWRSRDEARSKTAIPAPEALPPPSPAPSATLPPEAVAALPPLSAPSQPSSPPPAPAPAGPAPPPAPRPDTPPPAAEVPVQPVPEAQAAASGPHVEVFFASRPWSPEG